MKKHPRASPMPWTPEDVALLRRLYPDTRSADIAAMLGRPVTHIYAKACRLGLGKNTAFYARDLSGRMLAGERQSVATQFRPGNVPWNKGVSYQALGRSLATQFKPGQKPPGWKPIGSLRISSSGHLQRKCTDTHYAPRDWVSVHRLVWEQAHGPLEHGRVVVFKPGRLTTDEARITLDAIECITRRELMERNSVHARYPRELARVAQLRGTLTRQINRKAKETKEHTAP